MRYMVPQPKQSSISEEFSSECAPWATHEGNSMPGKDLVAVENARYDQDVMPLRVRVRGCYGLARAKLELGKNIVGRTDKFFG